MAEITRRFKVRVTRYHGDENSRTYLGTYCSEVYAISKDEKKFLVYDPGEVEDIPSGFEWVDFTKMIPPIGNYDEECNLVPMVRNYENYQTFFNNYKTST